MATGLLSRSFSSFNNYRKLRIKRRIRVPSVSNKLADIPPDDYSWRKYGQKPIKGSPYPRFVNFPFFFLLNLSKNFLSPVLQLV